jgi:hypothetical protein
MTDGSSGHMAELTLVVAAEAPGVEGSFWLSATAIAAADERATTHWIPVVSLSRAAAMARQPAGPSGPADSSGCCPRPPGLSQGPSRLQLVQLSASGAPTASECAAMRARRNPRYDVASMRWAPLHTTATGGADDRREPLQRLSSSSSSTAAARAAAREVRSLEAEVRQLRAQLAGGRAQEQAARTAQLAAEAEVWGHQLAESGCTERLPWVAPEDRRVHSHHWRQPPPLAPATTGAS